MRPIVYDLTEVFYRSLGKLKYYGIVHTVVNIAVELHKRNPQARFAIYSPAHDDFFEIIPARDESAEGGVCLNVPVNACPTRIRDVFHKKKPLRDALMPVIQFFVRRKNLKRWREAGVDLQSINLDGCALVMTGRPKLMLPVMASIERKGWDVDFHTLLHDMIPMHDFSGHCGISFKSNFYRDNCYIISHAKQIIANSEFTKSDIEQFSASGVLPPLPDIVAVPLVHECRRSSESPQKELPSEPYLLSVGALLGRKNLEVVFNALLDLHERGRPVPGRPVPKLILVGAMRNHITKYMDREVYISIRDKLEQSANPNQTDLVRYYENALALVIASRMEGWGLPAGEALWLGTPALCSTAPALREVCGDLGLYFDPDSPRELADHIDRLMTEPGWRQAVVDRIKAAHPQMRVWGDVAQGVLDAVARV